MRIAVLTTTRAEYGLMRPLLQKMEQDKAFELTLLVSGTHLSQEYGMTIDEIEKDHYSQIIKIPILSKENGITGVSETMSNAIDEFTKYFLNHKPDYLFVDGDRYETLAVAIAAVNCKVPIIHNGGGCTTEGAADEYYRHAITKMGMLHFTSTEEYRNRIIQMGENPKRVFAVGSLGIENIISIDLLDKEILEKDINFKLDQPYSVVTFHPVTLENGGVEQQVDALLESCDSLNMKFIFTKANADAGGDIVNKKLEGYVNSHSEKAILVPSLGMLRYLSALKYCEFVMGNSSSGLIEVPSFHVPTINIGDRQKGRLKAESVIDCEPDKESIMKAVQHARSKEFKKICTNVINPNGDGKTSSRIIKEIKRYYSEHGLKIQKSFYNISH